MNIHWYAWAAGIIDGEGTFHYHTGKRHTSWHIRLSVPQAAFVEDEPPRMLTKLHELFGGSVRPKKTGEPNRRPMWTWTIDSRGEVHNIATLIWPWLGPEKRAQFEKCWGKVTFINKSPSPKVTTICAACGRETVAAPSARRRYCSWECYQKTPSQRDSVTGQFLKGERG